MSYKSPYVDVRTPEGVKVKGVLIELQKGVEPRTFEKKVLTTLGREQVGHAFGTTNFIFFSYLEGEEGAVNTQMEGLQKENPNACKVTFLNDPFVPL